MKSIIRIFIITLSVLLMTSFKPAFATETYECSFKEYSDQKGKHKEDMNLMFVFDKSANKAYMIGNNGSNEVIPIEGENGITFVEITGTRNVMTTTISSEMKSVHSRHSVMFTGEILPSQFYGSCVKK